jgi:hypothetical protein
MEASVARAETEAQKEAVYRFRYSVYVEEMGRYQDTADHVGRRLVEPEDELGWVFFAQDGGDVVGTARLSWGADGFSDRQIDEYSLVPFLDQLPAGMLAVGERVMVMAKYRGTGLVDELLECRRSLAAERDVRIVFSACEPHLLSLYLSQGRKTYADKNINGIEAGYLIPLVSFPQGTEVLEVLAQELGALSECVDRVLSDSGGAVLSPLMTTTGEYPERIRETLHEIEDQEISAFHGFTDDEVERCLDHSNVISCAAGDRVLKKGGIARNIFVVLGGTLEVRDEARVVAVLQTGDVFGEMAFLLERPRVLDTYAATDSVRVLSLSERALRGMISDDAVVAAKLLLNISKMLCVRLIQST